MESKQRRDGIFCPFMSSLVSSSQTDKEKGGETAFLNAAKRFAPHFGVNSSVTKPHVLDATTCQEDATSCPIP